MLDIREVRRDLCFTNIIAAHVSPQLNPRLMDRHRLGHQVDNLARRAKFGEREHFDKPQEVTWVIGLNQRLEGKAHPFDVDVLAVIAHRTAHVHDDHGRTFGMVACAMHFDLVTAQTQRPFLRVLQQHIDDRLRQIDVR